jgi:hypothetical protein
MRSEQFADRIKRGTSPTVREGSDSYDALQMNPPNGRANAPIIPS